MTPPAPGNAGAGRFFSLEGLDGSGKSTQVALLERALARAGLPVLVVREPGGTQVSEEIRQVLLNVRTAQLAPETELLLFASARAQLVRERIRPAMAQGTTVLADRFGWSGYAYQGSGRGIPRWAVDAARRVACGPTWPEHSFLLDLDPRSMPARLAGGRADRMESMGIEFFTRVREGYLSLPKEFPGAFTVLEAQAPMAGIHAAICKELARRLERPLVPEADLKPAGDGPEGG